VQCRLTLMGPGDWSLDAQFDHRLNRAWMPTAAIVASSTISLLVVRRRNRVLAAEAAETTTEGEPRVE